MGKYLSLIREFFDTGINALSTRVRSYWSGLSSRWRRDPTHNWYRPDYDFWRRAYYCRAAGLELSGLFIKPLVNKVTAWTIGRPPNWQLDNEPSQEALNGWWADNHASIIRAYRASVRQGDEFIVVNPDLSLTLIAPETVTPIVADNDYSVVIGWRVTQTYPHPETAARRMTVIDEYEATQRRRIIELDGVEVANQTFPNLIGRLPIVHIANNPDDNEMFGHAEAEALVEVLHRYGLILEAGIDGNQLQGRPTPVLSFESSSGKQMFEDDHISTENRTLPSGTTETTRYLDVDLSSLLLVSGAEFEYKSPGAFIGDTQQLLELMFYLILEHTELPEFVFGNAIASSKASAETQMPVFVRFIEMKQGDAGGWLVELAEIALALLSLIDPAVSTAESPSLQWEPLSQQDGQLTLATVQWAFAEGLLDEATALTLAPVDIEDITAVLEKAREERAERQEERNDDLAIFRDEVNRMEVNEDGNE